MKKTKEELAQKAEYQAKLRDLCKNSECARCLTLITSSSGTTRPNKPRNNKNNFLVSENIFAFAGDCVRICTWVVRRLIRLRTFMLKTPTMGDPLPG
jgi:hypothetical protein